MTTVPKTQAEIAEAEKETAIKIEQGKEIMEKMGFKAPERVTMRTWNNIVPVQKRIEAWEVSDIEGIVQMYIAVNVWEIKAEDLENGIMDMEIGDFEKISLYVWKILEKADGKKK